MNKAHKKIMLIDDEPISNLVNRKILSLYNSEIEVLEFTEAERAIESLQQHSPDFIYLDLNMPVMDGWMFLDEMKIRGLLHPVVILTSSCAAADMEKSRQHSNVISYQLKPLHMDMIHDVLQRSLPAVAD